MMCCVNWSTFTGNRKITVPSPSGSISRMTALAFYDSTLRNVLEVRNT